MVQTLLFRLCLVVSNNSLARIHRSILGTVSLKVFYKEFNLEYFVHIRKYKHVIFEPDQDHIIL